MRISSSIRKRENFAKEGQSPRFKESLWRFLAILLDNPGKVVTRDQLQKHLWPADTFVDFEHGLSSAVRRLQDALNDSAETPRYIETLARRCYRFIKDVERLEQSPKLARESEKSGLCRQRSAAER